jgi:glycosyltransferase involved in cell wall biosynthesis
VVIHGEIADAASFISHHSAMVVPLFSGSGMRVKIIEGMALGKLVISTSLGKEGIDARHKNELIVADDEDAFVQAIGYCYENSDAVSHIGVAAKSYISKNYNNLQIAKKLHEAYEDLLVNGHGH